MLLPAAMDYLLHHPGSDVNIVEFDKECGVGIVVTAEEIKDAVSVLLLYHIRLAYRAMCILQ